MKCAPPVAFAAALLASSAALAGTAVAIEELTLVYEGLAFSMSPTGEPSRHFVRMPDRPWIGVDLLAAPATPDAAALDVTSLFDGDLGFAVQVLGDDSVLRSSFFHASDATASAPSHGLRDRRTLAVVPPATTRQIAIDPSDPSGNTVYAFDALLRANGLAHGFATSFFKPVGGLGYETEVVDYREGGVSSRTTPIDFTPASEPLAADFTADPSGRVFGVFASPDGLSLFDLIDPQGQIVAQPLATLPAPTSFDPTSVQLGIIAILIGLVETPVPSISFQAGNELFLYAYDGAGGFDPVAQQTIPAGMRGLMEEEGIFYFTLDGASNVVRAGVVGSPPDVRIVLDDVSATLDASTPAGSPSSFESADGDAALEIAPDWTPPPGLARSGVAASGDAVLRSVANRDLAFSAHGRRGAALRSVLPSQPVAGSYESSGALARSFVLDVEQMPTGDVFDPAVDAAAIDMVNGDVAERALFVFDDTDGTESIALLGVTSNLASFEGIRASSYRAEVVPWLWLLPGASASIEHPDGDAGPRVLDVGIHESEEEQTAVAVTPTSFVAATNDATHADVAAFAAEAAAALGGPVEVLAYASAAARTETVDKDETITIHSNRTEATRGDDLFVYWGSGLEGTGNVTIQIAVENDATQFRSVLHTHQGSIATLGAALAGTAEPLTYPEEVWNQAAVAIAGDPDQPIILGVPGVGIVRLVPEPMASAAGAAALVALAARVRRRASRPGSGRRSR